ncbi:hypothetical protein [Alcanivorax sp. DP30]|uniref:hypothetical protein n=1 Tax=Alcanivorax sp. DP30 TaxID=2606217 RepID=UPI00137105A9|nr:hypothetical protein [Alcanivorax sp. DP30]MZR61786.1 hypothetical protein [Alcanivorax sp. DP30]
MTSPFVAFPCSDALRSETEKLIINLNAGVTEPQNKLAMQTIDLLIEDLLAGFLLNLIDVLEMKNFMARLVRSTGGTINKAGSSIANASLKKMDNKQMRPMADHVASLMLDVQINDEVQPWMGVPVDEALSSEIEKLIDGLRSDNPKVFVPMAMDVLEKLTDQAADVYISQSVQLLQVGMVLRKMASAAISAVKGAMRMMNKKTLPDLNEEQLRALADYIDDLHIMEGEPVKIVSAA